MSRPRCMVSKTLDLRQRKFVVAVNDSRNCFVQLVFGDVPLIDKGYLPPVQTTDGARGLGWAEIETVAKGGYKVTLFWFSSLLSYPEIGPKCLVQCSHSSVSARISRMPTGVIRSFKGRSKDRNPSGSGLRRRRFRIASPFSMRKCSFSGNAYAVASLADSGSQLLETYRLVHAPEGGSIRTAIFLARGFCPRFAQTGGSPSDESCCCGLRTAVWG